MFKMTLGKGAKVKKSVFALRNSKVVCTLNFRFMPKSQFYPPVKNRVKWPMVNIVLQA